MNKVPGKTSNPKSKPKTRKPDRVSKLLVRMRENPQNDWNINDFQSVCDYYGLTFTAPKRGSHFKISSPLLIGILTVPARRPIKSVYINKFLALIDAHILQSAKGDIDE